METSKWSFSVLFWPNCVPIFPCKSHIYFLSFQKADVPDNIYMNQVCWIEKYKSNKDSYEVNFQLYLGMFTDLLLKVIGVWIWQSIQKEFHAQRALEIWLLKRNSSQMVHSEMCQNTNTGHTWWQVFNITISRKKHSQYA